MSISPQSDFGSKPHILVVDDDAGIRKLVSQYLRDNDFLAISAGDAAEARGMLDELIFDALVVDVMMPGENGLSLVEHVQTTSGVPVLLLTALGEPADRISGLEAGADDYLSKPFEPRELVLRLQALLRRSNAGLSSVPEGGHFKIGPWIFDAEACTLYKEEDQSAYQGLTGAESALLMALADRPGQPVSREDLAQKLGLDGGERAIDVQVARLRRKIESETKTPRYLQTVRGKGYLLRVESVEAPT